MIMTGKDAGKTGTVLHTLPLQSRVVVEGLNMVKRAVRSRVAKEKSQIIEKPASVHVSNVMVVDPKGGKPTRVGLKKVDGKNVRIAKKSGSELK